jgi:hypothetical protein
MKGLQIKVINLVKPVIRILIVALIYSIAPLTMAADLSTPEGALKFLEDAYVRKDLEAAVSAKDFQYEARAMLNALKNLKNPDDELVQKTADVLELSFRKQIQTKGFPDFTQLRCSVVSKKLLQPDLVEMTEECIFPDGGKSTDILHATKSSHGWRIVILPPV